jgi:hypothetical protein
MNTEKQKYIQIRLDKDNNLTVEAEGVILPEIIQLCLAAIEGACKQTLSRANDPTLVKSLEEDMYEMINLGASTLLNKLFPEIEMRPDITVDAVMKAENELIEEKGEEYKTAYEQSAQSVKDEYEHNIAKANLAAMSMNREQRRKYGIKKKL